MADGLRFLALKRSNGSWPILGLKNDSFMVAVFLNGLQIFSINMVREVKLAQNWR